MPHRLKQLQARHHAAIRMRLEGRSSAEICEELDITLRTLYVWFSDPLVKEGLASAQADMTDQLREKINQGVLTAIECLRQMVAAPIEGPVPAAVKAQAARALLDRMPTEKQPEAAQEPSGVEKVIGIMSRMSPEERREFGARAARRLLEMKGNRVIEAGSAVTRPEG
ncbi:MAG: helix-turn-helix domain-containing protein [Solirubrobacterales bacterium]